MEGPAGEEHEAWLSLIICLQVYSGPFSWASWERLKIVHWVVPLPSAARMAGFIRAVIVHFNLGKLKSLHIFRSGMYGVEPPLCHRHFKSLQ